MTAAAPLDSATEAQVAAALMMTAADAARMVRICIAISLGFASRPIATKGGTAQRPGWMPNRG